MRQFCIFNCNLGLIIDRRFLHVSLQFFPIVLHVGLILLGLALGFSHAGFLDHLGIRRQGLFGRLLALLGHLDQLLEGLAKLRKHLLGIKHDVGTDRGVQLVDGRGQRGVVVVRDGLATGLGHIPVGAVQIPQGHVLFDVLDQVVQEGWICKWALAKERVQTELQVILNVGDVILLEVGV